MSPIAIILCPRGTQYLLWASLLFFYLVLSLKKKEGKRKKTCLEFLYSSDQTWNTPELSLSSHFLVLSHKSRGFVFLTSDVKVLCFFAHITHQYGLWPFVSYIQIKVWINTDFSSFTAKLFSGKCWNPCSERRCLPFQKTRWAAWHPVWCHSEKLWTNLYYWIRASALFYYKGSTRILGESQ